MARALTQLSIDKLKPGQARREVPDGQLRGLFLIVQPTGKMSWAVRYRHYGLPRKLTIGSYPSISLKDARTAAMRALSSIADGKDPAAEGKRPRSLQRPRGANRAIWS